MTAVCLPDVNMNCMDHLTFYTQIVTDITLELYNLILFLLQWKAEHDLQKW